MEKQLKHKHTHTCSICVYKLTAARNGPKICATYKNVEARNGNKNNNNTTREFQRLGHTHMAGHNLHKTRKTSFWYFFKVCCSAAGQFVGE